MIGALAVFAVWVLGMLGLSVLVWRDADKEIASLLQDDEEA